MVEKQALLVPPKTRFFCHWLPRCIALNNFCPGVDKGRVWCRTGKEIKKIAKEAGQDPQQKELA